MSCGFPGPESEPPNNTRAAKIIITANAEQNATVHFAVSISVEPFRKASIPAEMPARSKALEFQQNRGSLFTEHKLEHSTMRVHDCTPALRVDLTVHDAELVDPCRSVIVRLKIHGVKLVLIFQLDFLAITAFHYSLPLPWQSGHVSHRIPVFPQSLQPLPRQSPHTFRTSPEPLHLEHVTSVLMVRFYPFRRT